MRTAPEDSFNNEVLMVGDWRVNCAGHLIERNGESVRVEAMTMRLLLCLAKRPGEVVRREFIEDCLWPKSVVGYDALTQAVAKLRKALRDDGRHSGLIETVPKSGYRLVAPVRKLHPQTDCGNSALPNAELGATRNLLPSIAVMPFENMDRDPNMEYFSDGITEDIIVELARCPDLRVISRHSCFSYKGRRVPLDQLRRELGVRFVLAGTVRRSDNKVRITARLVDAISGNDVWAKLFDEEAASLVTLQDLIRKRIVAAIVGEEGQIRRTDYGHAWAKPSLGLDEYDYYLRVHSLIFRFTKKDNAHARDIAIEALQRFPASSLIKIKLGWTYMLDARMGWSADPPGDIEKASQIADQGLADVTLHSYGQAVGHWLKAYAYLFRWRAYDLALAETEIATSLAPNDSDLLASLSLVLVYCGMAEKGLELIHRAIDQEPVMPSFFNRFLGWVYYHLERYADAAECAGRLSLVSLETLRLQAASHAKEGRIADARKFVARFKDLDSGMSLTRLRMELPYRNPTDLERELAGLRVAGLRE